MSQYSERVGRNIAKYRAESGQTLREIAKKVGVTEATVQKYEAGSIKRVDVDMLEKLADALGVLPERLVEWESREQYENYRKSNESKEDIAFFAKYKLLSKAQKAAVRSIVNEMQFTPKKKWRDE